MSETHEESVPKQDAENDIAGATKPVRTPSKRKSKLEREREESEEIIKSMGGAVEEGGRRTRSSARGSAPVTPVAAKKPRATTPRGRAKPKKVENSDNEANDEVEKDQPAEENDDKQSKNEKAEPMEVDGETKTSNDSEPDVVKSKDVEDKSNNDDSKDKKAEVEQSKVKNSEVAKADSATVEENTPAAPAQNDTAANVDAIEKPKSEPSVLPSPVKDSPVKRPVEEAAVPDAATEPAVVNEKANDCSHVNNVSDAVVANKTEETKDDAPSNAEPTIKPTESAEVAAAL